MKAEHFKKSNFNVMKDDEKVEFEEDRHTSSESTTNDDPSPDNSTSEGDGVSNSMDAEESKTGADEIPEDPEDEAIPQQCN